MERDHVSTITLIATILSILAMGYILVSRFDEFKTAIQPVISIENRPKSEIPFFITPAHAAESTAALTPTGNQKIIVIYGLYIAVALLLAAAVLMCFKGPTPKVRDLGGDLIKTILGFAIGVLTGKV